MNTDAVTREKLDRCLARFADAVMDGRDDDARRAFVDAQAMPVLAQQRDEVSAWVLRERALIDQLAAVEDLEALRPGQVETRLGRLRGPGGRR